MSSSPLVAKGNSSPGTPMMASRPDTPNFMAMMSGESETEEEIKEKSELKEAEAALKAAEEKAKKEAQGFQLSRYVDAEYKSEEMQMLIRDRNEPPVQYSDIRSADQFYKSKDILPEWILKTNDWKLTKGKSDNNDMSEILKVTPLQRTMEQNSHLVDFLMSVWQTANMMGLKKCTQMLHEFKYIVYEPDENIITEGEEGLTFYIVIAGSCHVHKAGIGNVAQLGKGKSFGEIALAKGDVRTASIIAIGKVEVLSLHKSDYDHFIKDIQSAERRENFYLLRDCRLFANWPRAKIEKMTNSCSRKTLQPGEPIFHQGDVPDRVYVIMDGTIHIIKEVVIESKNSWPVTMNSWENLTRRTVKPILTNTLNKGDYFGEVAIIRGANRNATAKASQKTVLVMIDKLEFLHMISNDSSINMEAQVTTKQRAQPQDEQILRIIGPISGGPQSHAKSGEIIIYPNRIEKAERPKDSIVRKKKPKKPKTMRDKIREARLLGEGSVNSLDSMMDDGTFFDKNRYEEDMNRKILANKRVELLADSALSVVNTVEKQAVRELEDADNVLRQASAHREIIDPLLAIARHAKDGKRFGFKKLPPKSKPTHFEYVETEMAEKLHYSLNLPDERIGSPQKLMSYVVKTGYHPPGAYVRRLKGDNHVDKVIVKKRIPKPAEAFI